jgi:hypothetical protein
MKVAQYLPRRTGLAFRKSEPSRTGRSIGCLRSQNRMRDASSQTFLSSLALAGRACLLALYPSPPRRILGYFHRIPPGPSQPFAPFHRSIANPASKSDKPLRDNPSGPGALNTCEMQGYCHRVSSGHYLSGLSADWPIKGVASKPEIWSGSDSGHRLPVRRLRRSHNWHWELLRIGRTQNPVGQSCRLRGESAW